MMPSGVVTPISDAMLRMATTMREDRISWSKIATYIGCDEDTIRRRLDPSYAQRRREAINRARSASWYGRSSPGVGSAGVTHDPGLPKLSDVQYRQLVASIPRDTRPLTARIMGDPLPGRSALDARGGR